MFKKERIFLFIVFIFALLASRDLFRPGYFPMHDDLQMMRQLELEKCFLDGQIPCRWVPDMGYGFGFPLFNFYPPLPYLIGQGIRLFGVAFTTTVRLTFAFSFVVSGIAMYFLAKEFFGRLGGVLSSIFYIWAPYHAVDIYVRGAMNEAWALAWFPLIFWTGYRLIKEKKRHIKWIIALALSWFALLTSHNLMVLLFAPVFTVWVLIHLWRENAWPKIPQLIASGILSFGLAAFFILPAFLEQKYVQIETLIVGYYEYIAHFVDLNQMFVSRFWGYGASVWGENDGMPFQIGPLHWILSIAVGALLFYTLLKSKKLDIIKEFKRNDILVVTFYLLLVGWFSAFMAHSRSTPIWLTIPPLKFVQFPWRFLTLTTFAFSFVAGALPGLLGKWKISRGPLLKFFATYLQISTIFLLVFGLLFLNWNYFRPERIGAVTDEEKFSGEAWRIQQTAGIYDYLPKTAKRAPQEQRKKMADVLEGKAVISNEEQGTYWATFRANVEAKKAKIRVNILMFPNWKVFVDGQETKVFVPDSEEWGRMYIEVPAGEHQIYAQLYNTVPRTAGNLISLVSWAALVTIPIWRKRLSR